MPEITVQVEQETLVWLQECAEELGTTISDYGGGVLNVACEVNGGR